MGRMSAVVHCLLHSVVVRVLDRDRLDIAFLHRGFTNLAIVDQPERTDRDALMGYVAGANHGAR
jgi:hypothetical protein